MADASFVKDLFIRPQAVRKGDFVLELTQGVESPARTAADYVVTPSLVEAFDRALIGRDRDRSARLQTAQRLAVVELHRERVGDQFIQAPTGRCPRIRGGNAAAPRVPSPSRRPR